MRTASPASCVPKTADFSFANGDTLDFGGATVTSVQISRVAATEFDGQDLQNSARAFDLVLTLTSGGASHTLVVLDSYARATNAQWEAALGVDLAYPQPLPAGNVFVSIAVA